MGKSTFRRFQKSAISPYEGGGAPRPHGMKRTNQILHGGQYRGEIFLQVVRDRANPNTYAKKLWYMNADARDVCVSSPCYGASWRMICLSRSKGQRSRSPGRITHRCVGASGGCNGGCENVLAVGNCYYVAVCSAAELPEGASRPRWGGGGHTVAAVRLQLVDNWVLRRRLKVSYTF